MAGSTDLLRRYHQARQTGAPEIAAATLSLALMTPGYRDDALLCLGIELLESGAPQHAYLQFAAALPGLHAAPAQARALLARAALDQGRPEAARRLLAAALQRHPDDTTLRIWHWRALAATLSAQALAERMRAALPGVTHAAELRHILRHCARHAQDGDILGTVCYDAARGELRGWAVNLRAPTQPVRLRLLCGGEEAALNARHPHALLAEAGGPANQGGIIARMQPLSGPLSVLGPDDKALAGSPLAVVANLPHRPLADADVQAPPHRRPGSPGSARPVDVLVPVFDGREDTLACIHAVLQAAKANRTPHRVVALNDASPDAALAAELRELARTGRIDLVERPANLGFIRNINRGMLLRPAHDVVWLNADTLVHGDWLDRLRAAAYSARDIATATPFSNNGELLSFPRMREAAAMPAAHELAELDALAAARGNAPVEIETGCGFCLFIKRRALNEVGLLDETTLARGYGEETDWCLRARELGWKHVAATHVFIAHRGGVSFGAEKNALVKHNNDVLRRRYPDAPARFDAFVRLDPLAPTRAWLQRARLKAAAAGLRARPGQGNRTLWIQGPTSPPRNADETVGIHLHYRRRGQTEIEAQLIVHAGGLPIELDYRLPRDAGRLHEDLRRLQPRAIGYRHATRCPDALRSLPAALRLPIVERSAAWPEPVRPAEPADPAQGAAILVADDLRDAGLAAHWLDVARDMARAPADRRLYLVLPNGNGPWMPALQATGAVLCLPAPEGLEQAEHLALAGCTAAASLQDEPDADWIAPWIAHRAGLPLYAPASALALQAGARPLNALAVAIPPPAACAA